MPVQDAAVALPGLLLRFLEEASVAMGSTRDRALAPSIHWVTGWKAEADGRSIRCVVPREFGAGLAEAIAENGRFALTLERIGSHETYQFKGFASELRPIADAERPLVAACRARFVAALLALGQRFQDPRLDLAGFVLDGALSFRLAVAEVYVQTPGPGAGKRLVPPERSA